VKRGEVVEGIQQVLCRCSAVQQWRRIRTPCTAPHARMSRPRTSAIYHARAAACAQAVQQCACAAAGKVGQEKHVQRLSVRVPVHARHSHST